MTEPFMHAFVHPPSAAEIIFVVLFWSSVLLITITLIGVGLYDLVQWSRPSTRQAWRQALTPHKSRRVRRLSLAGLFIGILAPVVSLLLPFISCAAIKDLDFTTVLTMIMYGWPLVVAGCVPFIIGQIMLVLYRRASRAFRPAKPFFPWKKGSWERG
jgi:hypothetical protein